MFCIKCGQQIPDGSTFCPLCGAQLGAPKQAPAQNTAAPEAPAAPQFQQPQYQQPQYQQPYQQPVYQAPRPPKPPRGPIPAFPVKGFTINWPDLIMTVVVLCSFILLLTPVISIPSIFSTSYSDIDHTWITPFADAVAAKPMPAGLIVSKILSFVTLSLFPFALLSCAVDLNKKFRGLGMRLNVIIPLVYFGFYFTTTLVTFITDLVGDATNITFWLIFQFVVVGAAFVFLFFLRDHLYTVFRKDKPARPQPEPQQPQQPQQF